MSLGLVGPADSRWLGKCTAPVSHLCFGGDAIVEGETLCLSTGDSSLPFLALRVLDLGVGPLEVPINIEEPAFIFRVANSLAWRSTPGIKKG